MRTFSQVSSLVFAMLLLSARVLKNKQTQIKMVLLDAREENQWCFIKIKINGILSWFVHPSLAFPPLFQLSSIVFATFTRKFLSSAFDIFFPFGLLNSPKVFTAEFISVGTLSGGREEEKSEGKLGLWGWGVIRR